MPTPEKFDILNVGITLSSENDMMIHTAATILIAAPPGPLRTALQALLSSLPGPYSIRIVGQPTRLLEIIPSEAPDLLILTGEALERWNGNLQELRATKPDVRIAVIVDDAARTPFELKEAQVVLQQGAPPAELIAALESLLPGSG